MKKKNKILITTGTLLVAEDIKYYISTSSISNTEKIEDSLWKNY